MREDEIGGRTIGINQKTLEVTLNFKKGTKKTVKIKQEITNMETQTQPYKLDTRTER